MAHIHFFTFLFFMLMMVAATVVRILGILQRAGKICLHRLICIAADICTDLNACSFQHSHAKATTDRHIDMIFLELLRQCAMTFCCARQHFNFQMDIVPESNCCNKLFFRTAHLHRTAVSNQ